MARVKRIVYFAQDEGSAKVLAPVIRAMPARARMHQSVVAGPFAARVFKQNGICCRETRDYAVGAAFSPKPDLAVTGASMRASIEKEAIGLARRAGIASATILDSPTWLWWRFTVNGTHDLEALADLILVPDPACKERMISERFPAERIVVTGNPHYDLLMARGAFSGQIDRQSVLVITQPEYENGGYRSDFAWLETVLKVCRKLDPGLSATIRPHSKEDPRRFAFLLCPRCHVDADGDILDLIGSHQVIIGKNSSALSEAALLGKTVISFTPGRKNPPGHPVAGWAPFLQAINSTELKGLMAAGLQNQKLCPLPRDIPYYTDGRNGERAIDSILTMLNNPKE